MTADDVRLAIVSRARPGTVAIVALALLAAGALALLWVDGTRTYVTDPVATIALAGSSSGIALLSVRRSNAGDLRGSRWLLALAASVAAYSALGALATGLAAGQSTVASAVVSLWSAWWAVPLLLIELAALSSVRALRGWMLAAGSLGAVAILAEAVLATPVDPFAGLPPAAPGGWSSPDTAGIGALVFAATLMTSAALLGVAAARERGAQRLALVLRASAAAIPPLTMIVCVGLAVARDPGDVSPALGSVGFLVALALGALTAASALALSAVRRPSLRAARSLIAGVIGGYAAVAALLLATVLVSWLAADNTLVAALAIAVLAAGVLVAWWLGSNAVLARVASAEPTVPTDRVAGLSKREAEVLALVAEGARDAEIAATLHLSERTVEAHMRRIFEKLELPADDGRNRRLGAARAWIEAHAATTDAR